MTTDFAHHTHQTDQIDHTSADDQASPEPDHVADRDSDHAVDVWAAFDHHPHTPVPTSTWAPAPAHDGDHDGAATDATIQIDRLATHGPETSAAPNSVRMHEEEPHLDSEPVDRRAVVAAVAATIALIVAAVAFFVTRGSSDSAAASAPTVSAPDIAASVPDPSTVDAGAPPTIDAIDPPVAVEPVPEPQTIDPAPVPSVTPSDPATPPSVVPPAPSGGGSSSPPPTPAPPVPAAVLQAQPAYELDPGVHGVTIGLHNHGDAALDYELTNVGDGYQAAEPIGQIEPGASADVWIDLDVSPDGDGPTPFERVVEVTSNGGDATITVTGQVEKPGHLVADHLSLPLIDFRATVSFTNLGGLPVEITEIDAPGFTWELLPDEVAAGETLELDVAICADDADQLPILENVPIPGPLDGFAVPGHEFGGHFTIGTAHGTSTVELGATSVDFDPPSCEPVIMVPAFELTLGG